MVDTPSLVRTMKTVVNECRKLSKLYFGDSPLSRSTWSRARLNFARCAKSSSPSRVKVKINRKRRMEKVATSAKVRPRVSSRISKRFQVLASLKILRSLKPLNAVMTEPLYEFTNKLDRKMSTKLATIMPQSKMLNIDPLK